MRSMFVSSLLLTLSAAPLMAQPVLDREPPGNALPAGQSVLVDDGSCPPGQVKRVVGAGKGAKRQRTCVARAGTSPGGSPVDRNNSSY